MLRHLKSNGGIMKRKGIMLGLMLLIATVPAFAQEVQPKTMVSKWIAGELIQTKGGSMAALQTGLPGIWWRDPEMVEKLSLTVEQQKKMDEIFLQYRLKLTDLNAALEKE